MLEPGKRTIKLGQKQCIVCSGTFQPASGAQKTCSPECKEKAKELGLNKRGPRNRGGVDPALREEGSGEELDSRDVGMKQFVNGQPIEVPQDSAPTSEAPQPARSRGSFRIGAVKPSLPEPELELDLSPLEAYIKALVRQEIAVALSEGVKEAVKAELGQRLQGLLGG